MRRDFVSYTTPLRWELFSRPVQQRDCLPAHYRDIKLERRPNEHNPSDDHLSDAPVANFRR